MSKSVDKKTIDLNFRFKEKNHSSQDFKAVMLAWFKGLTVFRETLVQLDHKDLLSSDLFYKIVSKFDLDSLEDNIESLRSLQTPPVHLQPTAQDIPADSLTLIAPKSLTKDELKNKIVDLAKIQDQPDFDFDLLITATHTLLNHSDITSDERSRYEIYYQELHEYKEYILLERAKATQHQPDVQPVPRSRSAFQPQTQYQPPVQTQSQVQPEPNELTKQLSAQLPSSISLALSSPSSSSQAQAGSSTRWQSSI